MLVWDADVYDEIFMLKDLKPLSCFQVYGGYYHVARAVSYSLKYHSTLRKDSYHYIQDLFRDNGVEDTSKWEYLVTYSARTSLDLFLQAKNYSKGSEVLMTAITTDGTIEIVRGRNCPNRNELTIVPVDIECETMGPSLLNVKSAVTEKTVAIICSYPYGIIYDISEIASFCREKGIDVIEDWSEAFNGIHKPGSPHADLTLMSFGMLKHYSCFGGAVWVVRRNPNVYKKMLEIEKSYRKERCYYYLTRVLKAVRLMTLLGSSDRFVLKMARVLQQYKILHYQRKPIWKLRQRVSLAWLRLLGTRLTEIDPIKHLIQYDKLQKYNFAGVTPGFSALQNTYWLYPVIYRESKKVIAACRFRGIQALAGKDVHWLATNSPKKENGESATPEAERLLEEIILLPINIETSEANIQLVQTEVVDAVNALNRGIQISPIRIISKI
jgi:dTDP-4-amino-4,6-dideoxygalactose transaminase